MRDLLPFVVSGLVGGASYALLALGLVLINKNTRILSFAHGEIGTFSTFVLASLALSYGWPWPVAIVVGMAVGSALGLGTRTVLLARGTAGRLPPLVGTIAMLSLLAVLEARYFKQPRDFPAPIHGSVLLPQWLGHFHISYVQILIIVAVGVICAGLWYLIERTNVGLMIRASADNATAARIVGLKPGRIEAVTWTLAGGLAALSGLFIGWTQQRIAAAFLTVYLLRAFTAAIVGGLTSLPGAIIGGVVIGVAESLTRKVWGQVPGSPEMVVFLILFLTLLLRPQGLFARRSRVLATEGSESLVALDPLASVPRRAPLSARDRTIRAVPLAVAAAVVVVGWFMVSEPLAYRLSIAPIFAIVALGLNSLVAGTGQLSLGHVGLMGLGAFMSAVAASSWHLPFALAVLVGPVATAAVALLLGTAALRVRGLYLAVMTMGFAVVMEAFVFPRPVFAHGGAGIALDRPHFWFVDLHGERAFLVFALVMMAAVWSADRRVLASPLGRAWLALRDNETAAAARGVRGSVLKVVAFTLSGFWAGLAGALFGYRQGLLSATQFPFLLSFTVLLYVVLGGIGSRGGVALVAGSFAFATTFARGGGLLNDFLLIAGAAGVVLTIGHHPEGMGGQVRHGIQKVRARRERREPDPTTEPEMAPDVGAAVVGPAVIEGAVGLNRPAPHRTGPPLLELSELSVQFSGLKALNEVSLTVDREQIVAVIGPNGAGKTTLFNVISGFVIPTTGDVRFRGRSVARLSPPARAAAGLGRTFQQGGLWPSETVRANLMIAQHLTVDSWSTASVLAIGPGQHRRERERRLMADEILAILGLSAVADRPVGSLPYGNRKVLELGCALVSQPSLLLLDEPAAGMNTEESAWLAGVISGIRDELAVALLVIEHHVPLVKRVADMVYVLNMGELLASGPPEQVSSDPRVLEAYLGSESDAVAGILEAEPAGAPAPAGGV